MAPPPYADLGKSARDVFTKGYNFGVLKLDVKTRTESGVEFTSGCTSNHENGKVNGSLESKYRLPDYGVTFTEKWTTDNVLATELLIQDQLAKGLKLSANGSFAPQTGNKTGSLKAAFAHEKVAVNADLDLTAGPLLTASAVLGYQGFVGGYQSKFNINDSKMTGNSFSIGYSTKDFILHTFVNNGEIFSGSVYHKVTPELDASIELSWSSGSNDTNFGIGGKYQLDSEAALRAKVNNHSQVGLGYQQRLRKGITVSLSALIDAKNFNQGGHKIGLALDMEA